MPRGILILPSFYEAIQGLEDLDRVKMYDAICRFGLYGDLPELPPHLNALFILMKPVIDSSQNRFQAAQENGRKGGRPKKKPDVNQTKNQRQNQTVKQNDKQDYDSDYKDYDSDSDLEKDSMSKKKPPSLEEIKAYVCERGSSVNPVEFFEYYETGGWKDSNGKPVRNWKQKLITWEKHEPKKEKARTNNQFLLMAEDEDEQTADY